MFDEGRKKSVRFLRKVLQFVSSNLRTVSLGQRRVARTRSHRHDWGSLCVVTPDSLMLLTSPAPGSALGQLEGSFNLSPTN